MNLEQDLAVLKTMAHELQEYLLSNVLFWQMQARTNFPKLSLGMLLLTRARLEAADAELSPEQRAEREAAERQIEATLGRWQVAAENKAEQELRSRVNLWQRFWEDCREEPRTCADNYPQAVTQRVIAELLLREFPRLAESPEAQALRPLDSQVRGRLVGDDFIWPDALRPGFPESEFWYLYGQPRYQVSTQA